MMQHILCAFSMWIFLSISFLSAQDPAKQTMDETTYALWKRIHAPQISNDGDWMAYTVKPGQGDPVVHLHHTRSRQALWFPRAENVRIDAQNDHALFTIKAPVDTVKTKRRQKVKKEDLPKDSLGIYDLQARSLTRIPNVKRYMHMPKFGGYVAYVLEAALANKDDSTQTKKIKKESDKNGYRLIVRELKSAIEDTFFYVTDFTLAEEGGTMLYATSGRDSTDMAGVFLFDFESRRRQALVESKGTYAQLTLNKKGNRAAFIADLDTSQARIRTYQLHVWLEGWLESTAIVDSSSALLPTDWHISKEQKLTFSENDKRLFFGIQPHPILQDTSLLEEEIVHVEVWSHTDGRLHTQQEVQLDDDKKKNFLVAYDVDRATFQRLGSVDIPHVRLSDEGNGRFALAYTDDEYQKYISWLGYPFRDVYMLDIESGARHDVAYRIDGNPIWSPKGHFIYWYGRSDSAWFCYNVATKEIRNLTGSIPVSFGDERNDRPMHPWPYGIAGWSVDDRDVFIYDRFDIWQIDPTGTRPATNLTNGRAKQRRYRYMRMDPEERSIDTRSESLLYVFDESSMHSGYARMKIVTGQIELLFLEPFRYSRSPVQARHSEDLFYTVESFTRFPDLIHNDRRFANPHRVSTANPQQEEYAWGNIELFEWTAFDGTPHRGLLVKPESFDPSVEYPLLVNFYERSSEGLYRHRAPEPHRSTINYSFYANRGYVIFNPDVIYEVGHPGASCYNSVISGVRALTKEGFIDTTRMALQGHSWGGYQVAHLLTKTDMFVCAESGAPVVNMISAYGGIRWRSGMSRMFQYERTQSRLGGTLWETPELYIENSPIFNMDRVNTPVLILHNDNDGAVPWYQGIEFFVALRRLGKEAWLLNYNDEPHWPLKWQNRMDFNFRMRQFFDHYLMDGPKPQWMERGVPAIEKSIIQGLEPSASDTSPKR